MVTAVDWPATLQRASFRGALFFFETDTRESGRRLVVHEFPGADQHVVEDMGRRAPRFSLTAYVLTSAAADALWSACTAGGVGILVRPTHGPATVRCEAIKEAHELTRLGYLAIDLTFVEVGIGGVDAFSIVEAATITIGDNDALGFAVTAALAAFVGGTSGGAIGANVGAFTGEAPALENAITSAVRGAIDRVEAAVMSVALPETSTRDVVDALRSAWDRVASPRQFLGPSVKAMATAMRTISVECDPDVGIGALRPLAAPPAVQRTAYSRSRRTAQAFDRAASIAVAVLAAGFLMRQEALGDWQARADATLSRERIRAAFDALAGDVGPVLGEAAYRRFAVVRDRAIGILTRRLTDLAPVIAIDTGTSQSAIRVAYELYANPNRALQIVRRNAVATPALMPTRLEVLQP